MRVTVQCEECGKKQQIVSSAAKTFRFCSLKCRSDWRRVHFKGAGNPKWQGGRRWKKCKLCGKRFTLSGQTQAYSTFKARKFCSKKCADAGGFRYEGETHPNWKPVTRKKDRRGKHGSWARAVIARDNAACRHCGATDVELHAHHIKSFVDHPDLRWDISNGLTLCYRCHWTVHSASNENGVNSGNIRPGNAEDNPEPSLRRKPLEGVTTSGRAFRKWVGQCDWCKTVIVKRLSDAVYKHAFCSKHCSGKFNAANRSYRRWKNPPDGSNAATSAPPERDEIV